MANTLKIIKLTLNQKRSKRGDQVTTQPTNALNVRKLDIGIILINDTIKIKLGHMNAGIPSKFYEIYFSFIILTISL